jgi:hypothetical protein
MPTTALLHLTQTAPSCGPSASDTEIGRALLLVLPLFVLLVPALRHLTEVWRGDWARDRPGGRAWMRTVFWAALISALACLPGATSGTFGLMVLAGWFAGASWLTLSLIGWRLLVHSAPERAAWLPAALVTGLFAVIGWSIRLDVSAIAEPAFFLTLLPGLAGIAPVALVLGFVVEAKLRGLWRSKYFVPAS